MANKNFMDASEVPRPTGDSVVDGKRMYSFSCNLVGQLGYQNELLTQQVNDLRGTNATLTQELEALRKQIAALSKGKDG